jgi:hypothetical protein
VTRPLPVLVLTAAVLLPGGTAWAQAMGAEKPGPTAAAARSSDLPAGDPLGATNAAFRAAYAALRSETLAKTEPILFSAGDDLVLLRAGKRAEAKAVTARYHALKAVAHVPLAVYVMLASGAGAPLPQARLDGLKEYRGLVAKARDSLRRRSWAAGQLERQERLVNSSLKLLDSALAAGRVSAEELTAFTRAQRTDIQANVRAAARDQIDTMDAQVTRWLKAMTSEERACLRVVVSTPHMPRTGNIAYQYFQAKLGGPYQGRDAVETDGSGRLVLVEATWDEQKALNVLATHVVDAGIAVSFFDDAERMHRDLLADAAEEAIAARLGRTPAPLK